MSCFGSSKEDRYFEHQLNKYLDSQGFGECHVCKRRQAIATCDICGEEFCDSKDCMADTGRICAKCQPYCECGEKTAYKCEASGEWCCGPDTHDCHGCEEGDMSVFETKLPEPEE